jgi:glycerol-3-phosphate acyltransferase PlsY
MDPLLVLLFAVGGYFVGSISAARLVTAIAAPGTAVPRETELRIERSDKTVMMQSVSATSVSANLGAKYGFITYVIDVLKVFIPVFVLKRVYPGAHYHLIAATAATAGHIWPLYHRFRGGRGISAIYGGVFAIDWLGVFATAFSGLVFGFVVLRDLYLTYILGTVFLIPWLWWRTHDPYVVLYAIAINVLLIASSFKEAKAWYRIKKEPGWNDPTEAWKISAMGRGIIKMGTKLGLIKKKEESGGGPRT